MSLLKKLKVLLKVSRPGHSWILGPLVFLMGLYYSGGNWTPLLIFQLINLSFPLCLVGYGINSVYDYDSDSNNPEKRSILRGFVLEPQYHNLLKDISLAWLFVMFLSSLLTFNLTNLIGMSLLLFFGYFYSAPPLRFKEKPPFGIISNGVIFIFAPFVIGYSFRGSILNLPSDVYWITASVIGGHAFTSLMDYSSDKEAGDRTFAVAFGKRPAAIFSFLVTTIVLLFGNFETLIVNYCFIFCDLLFLITVIRPSEELASLFFKPISLAIAITTSVFLFQEVLGLVNIPYL